MQRSVSPKFTLADLMILIFATGFGLGCYVLIDNGLFKSQRYLFGLFRSPTGGWNSPLVIDRAAGVLASMLPLFGGWTIALPVMILRKPRPARLRSRRGPGMTACVAALTGMATSVAVAGLAFALQRMVDGSIRLRPNFWIRGTLFDDLIIFAGVAAAAAWVAQVGTARWRPTPDWVDRLGRSLGGLWIASALVFAARQFLQ